MADLVISFVVPAKDEEAYVPATLESIRDQRPDRHYEVVVVDGDSDDATAGIARGYGAIFAEQSEADFTGQSKSTKTRTPPSAANSAGSERLDSIRTCWSRPRRVGSPSRG